MVHSRRYPVGGHRRRIFLVNQKLIVSAAKFAPVARAQHVALGRGDRIDR